MFVTKQWKTPSGICSGESKCSEGGPDAGHCSVTAAPLPGAIRLARHHCAVLPAGEQQDDATGLPMAAETQGPSEGWGRGLLQSRHLGLRGNCIQIPALSYLVALWPTR